MILYSKKINRLSLKCNYIKQSREVQDGAMNWVGDAKVVSGSGRGRGINQKSQSQMSSQEAHRERMMLANIRKVLDQS